MRAPCVFPSAIITSSARRVIDDVEFAEPKRRKKKSGIKRRKQDDAVSVCSTNPYDSLSEPEAVENPGVSPKARTSETTRKLPPIVVINYTLSQPSNLAELASKSAVGPWRITQS